MNRRTKKKSGPDWVPAFLAALRVDAHITNAAKLAGVPVRTMYDRRDRDPEFAEAMREALDQSVDDLELVARKRANESSDVLLIFLLKANRPEKYRERHEVRHTGGTTVQIIEETVSDSPGPREAAPGPAGVPQV